MVSTTSSPAVRATALLVSDGCLLLVKQVLRERTHWNLPGGKVEAGERVDECLVREMREECGLHVEPAGLLYVCDRFKGLGGHVVDMSFEVRLAADETRALEPGRSIGPFPCGECDDRLDDIRMVPVGELALYGFSEKFARLVAEGFPGRGSYGGDFHEFYGVAHGRATARRADLRTA